jgi:hypothetical protein
MNEIINQTDILINKFKASDMAKNKDLITLNLYIYYLNKQINKLVLNKKCGS